MVQWRSWRTRRPALGCQRPQQHQDLCLDCDIERGGGFVGDDQLRLGQERHGDHQPLTLTAGQFMRIFPQQSFRVRQLHQP